MATRIPLALLATALACSLFAAPAHALRARVFVAKTGTDVGSCSFSAPCQSLNFAYNAVLAGGEITILDNAGYEPLTISKALTITGPAGVEAGIAVPSGGTAITISAGPSDAVVLRGLTLNGGGSGQYGIVAHTGGNIEIVDCSIRGFTNRGIEVDTDQSAQMSVAILNTLVADTPVGIDIITVQAAMQVAMDGVKINNNSVVGINLFAGGFALEVSIANSRIDNAGSTGLSMQGTSPTLAVAFLRNVTITQTATGIALAGSSVIYLSQIQQQAFFGFNNTAGISFSNTGNVAFSDGTNHIQGNIVGGSLTSWTFQ
jgi:hypothetical protein